MDDMDYIKQLKDFKLLYKNGGEITHNTVIQKNYDFLFGHMALSHFSKSNFCLCIRFYILF